MFIKWLYNELFIGLEYSEIRKRFQKMSIDEMKMLRWMDEWKPLKARRNQCLHKKFDVAAIKG